MQVTSAPHIVRGMSSAEYHAIDRLSASGTGDILRSPAHYDCRRNATSEPSRAMRIGTAVHANILEPEWAERFLIRRPDGIDRRTKAGKAAWAEFEENVPEGAIVMDTAEWDTAANVSLAVTLNEPLRRARLLQGEYEVSAFFDIDGCPAKCRFDVVAERGFVVDLKTTQDASQFERSVVKWGYHRQAALYQMGAAAVGVECKAFIFVVVETAAPYGIRVVTLDSDALIQGEREVHRAAKLYRECMESGEWPGYSSDLQTVSLPLWALDQED
jgi:exodeoxyribonuclease VIII